jgi:hypothetical protein
MSGGEEGMKIDARGMLVPEGIGHGIRLWAGSKT